MPNQLKGEFEGTPDSYVVPAIFKIVDPRANNPAEQEPLYGVSSAIGSFEQCPDNPGRRGTRACVSHRVVCPAHALAPCAVQVARCTAPDVLPLHRLNVMLARTAGIQVRVAQGVLPPQSLAVSLSAPRCRRLGAGGCACPPAWSSKQRKVRSQPVKLRFTEVKLVKLHFTEVCLSLESHVLADGTEWQSVRCRSGWDG